MRYDGGSGVVEFLLHWRFSTLLALRLLLQCLHARQGFCDTNKRIFSPSSFLQGIITLFFCFFCLFVSSNGVLLDRGARITAYLGNWGISSLVVSLMKTIMFF
jgi:hypothetical protein